MKYCLLLIVLLFTINCQAQLMGFKLPEGQDKVEIPFEFQNNFIIIDVVFEDAFPLKFIFDTGSENTILINKGFTDILDISYDRRFKIIGADQTTELIAYLVRGVNLDMPNLAGSNLDFLVLEDDYFQFEEYTGLKIHGILGLDLFKTFTIKIDYDKKILTLYRVENFKPPTGKYKSIHSEIYRSKPYIKSQAKISSDTSLAIKLLLDTGASLALMLHNNSSDALDLPEKLVPGNIGNGLGGYIKGFVGRINALSFDEFFFSNVITNFQELKDSTYIITNNNRNGILGNEILSRFTIIFDLSRSRVYFKPIKKYNKGFKYDRSGITVISSGKNLQDFMVKNLVPNSPAATAGIKVGDKIKNINYIPISFYDLRSITKIFQKRAGKRIRLIIERDGIRQKVVFRLEDLI